jgi:hypothetical protein
MKKISLELAKEIIDSAAACKVIDGANYSVSFMSCVDENEFLNFEFCDKEGLVYEYRFFDYDNEEVCVDNGQLILIDNEKCKVKITPLIPLPLK